MESELKQILKKAIDEEQFFIDFYSKKSEETDNPSLKKLFSMLAEQEMKHREKLENFDDSGIEINEANLEKINLGENLMLTPVNEYKDMKDVINFAIKSEISAWKMYEGLRDSVSKGKEIFQWLVDEEKRHEDLLREELKEMEI